VAVFQFNIQSLEIVMSLTHPVQRHETNSTETKTPKVERDEESRGLGFTVEFFMNLPEAMLI